MLCGWKFASLLHLSKVVCLGFTNAQWCEFWEMERKMNKWRDRAVPPLPEQVEFVRKHLELPELGSYEGILPDTFWACWTKRYYSDLDLCKSWVNADRLEEMARNVGYKDEERLQRVLTRLKKGADIGCRGKAREPTSSE